MADNNFRSYRSHDPPARNEHGRSSGAASGDPLAELARLIGQGDPYAEAADQPRSNRSSEEVGRPADERYAAPHNREEDRYAAPPPAPPADASHSSYAAQPAYEDEPAVRGRYFSGPAAKFNGFREETDAGYREERAPAPREIPDYAAEPDQGYEADEAQQDGSEPYAADDYYDVHASPRRRSGLVVVMMVLGLAVAGTAGAFAYRAMFGGSVLPTLPPIIKASNGPNKIIPNSVDSQPSNSRQTAVANASSAESVVSREEQPINMEPPRTAPRVVSTIPIIAQNSASPGMAAPVATGAVPPAPPVGATATSLPNSPPPASIAAPMMPAAAPAQASSEPKKIHTVTIRADQSGGLDVASTSPPSAPAARSATRSASAAAKPAAAVGPAAGSNAPLSIVPDARGAAAASRAPATAVPTSAPASAPMSVASAGSVTGAAPSSAGGYAVQVTSQRSEAEAQAAFRTLRAKFPNQLSGREPIIRRADLGAKGTYYRALVGPFASVEEAAGLCSGLKAAGGNCIVQRN